MKNDKEDWHPLISFVPILNTQKEEENLKKNCIQ